MKRKKVCAAIVCASTLVGCNSDVDRNVHGSASTQVNDAPSNNASCLPIVKKITADLLGIPVTKVKATSEFVKDLGCDSLDTVELVMEFEERFNIAIADKDAERIVTVGMAAEYIDARLRAQGE